MTPSAGATTSPTLGSMATPLPMAPLAKTASGVSSRAITSPANGLVTTCSTAPSETLSFSESKDSSAFFSDGAPKRFGILTSWVNPKPNTKFATMAMRKWIKVILLPASIKDGMAKSPIPPITCILTSKKARYAPVSAPEIQVMINGKRIGSVIP